MNFKILVTDNTDISLLYTKYLVTYTNSEDEILNKTYHDKYGLYIFHIKYFDILKELKQSGDKTLTIFIDDFYHFTNFQKAYQIGDDYIIKPVYHDELLVKINYFYKKTFDITTNVIKYQDFYFHLNSKQLFKKNLKIKLSPTELLLSELFLTQKDKPINKETIFYTVGSENNASLRVYISKLKKIGFNIKYDRAIDSYILS